MNNPNPFVPKGSLLEQQSQRRSRLKLAVFCVLAVSVTGLVAMLIQGGKREQPSSDNPLPPVVETSTNLTPPVMDLSSNLAPPLTPSNTVVIPPPVPTTPPPTTPPPAVETPGSEYVIVAGDTLGKIAKAHGTTAKAIEAANPGVDPKKLKIGKKLVIPASTKSAEAAPAAPAGAVESGGEVYSVKSGDTLSKIAKKHGMTPKALKAANNLTTDRINVGQKLKLPAKSETAAPAPAAETTAAPAPPAVSAPATPAPATTPGK